MHTHTLRSLHWTDLERHVKSRERTRRECTRTDCATSTPPTWLTPLTAANSWRSNPAPSGARCTLAVISLQTAIHDVIHAVLFAGYGEKRQVGVKVSSPRAAPQRWFREQRLRNLTVTHRFVVFSMKCLRCFNNEGHFCPNRAAHTHVHFTSAGFLWWR